MFNLGAGEVLVILLLALIVLGPQRLPEAARQAGRLTAEIRKLSAGFKQEMRTAFEAEAEQQARARGDALVAKAESPTEPEAAAPESAASDTAASEAPAGDDGGDGDGRDCDVDR